jgi:hypothetical protein
MKVIRPDNWTRTYRPDTPPKEMLVLGDGWLV